MGSLLEAELYRQVVEHRSLRKQLLAPERIVVVGASRDPGTVGHSIWQNILASADEIPVHAVNPHAVPAPKAFWHADIRELPPGPGLAVLALPAKLVPTSIEALGAKGIDTAVIVTAGLAPSTPLGASLRSAARRAGVRVIGPNCIGLLLPRLGINASFAAALPPPGRLALLSQSGAIAASLISWGAEHDVGFSGMLSVGDMADVGFAELLRVFGEDPHTDAILLYLEGLRDGAAFLAAAREVGRTKPVIVLKAGRESAGGKAALSHTGALAGSWEAYQAAFDAAGIISVDSLDDLCATASLLRFPVRPAGNRLAIVTNGGGAGILAVDALEDADLRLAELGGATIERLGAMLPPVWSGSNPIDIIGDAGEARYRAVLQTVLADPDCDMVLVMNCPTGVIDPAKGAGAVADAARQAEEADSSKPVIGCWLGPANFRVAQPIMARDGIACFSDPTSAVKAIGRLAARSVAERHWPVSDRGPGVPATASSAARKIIRGARSENRRLLSEVEAKELLGLFGICAVPTRFAATSDGAEAVCNELAPPYAVKIVSPDIAHKTDVGGVALGLSDPAQVREAAMSMEARVTERLPRARVEGFAVQEMVERTQGVEVFAGLSMDATFGPMLMFGAGGTAIEVLADRAMAVTPLDSEGAVACIRKTRVARLLKGYRDVPPAKMEALTDILIALGRIAVALPEIAEIDLNPILARSDVALALDARVVLREPD